MPRTMQLPLLRRIFQVSIMGERRADDAQDPKEQIGQGRLYDVSISSELSGAQWYWDLGYVNETLSHKKSSVLLDRLKAAGPILWNHNRDDQVGRVFNPAVKDGHLVGKMKFSRTQRGQDFELDAVDEIKGTVSVGYRALEMKLVRRGDREKGELDDYEVTQWEPHEMSMVSIPFDITVGMGREEAEELVRRSGGETFPVLIDDGEAVMEENREMKRKPGDPPADEAEGGDEPTPVAAAAPVVQVVREAPAEKPKKTRNAEIAEMVSMARANDLLDDVAPAVERGLTPEQFAHEILTKRATVAAAQPAAEVVHGIDRKDLAKYSIRKAILMQLPRSEGGIEWGGIEAEVHEHLDRTLPVSIKRHEGAVIVPTNIQGPDPHAAQRAAKELGRAYPLDSVTSTEGAEFKFTGAGPFIEMLRNRLILVRLGARFLSGLTQPISLPRQTGASNPIWQTAEAAAVADSMAAFDLMPLVPRTLIDTTGTTRQLLRLASEDFEALLRDDLLKSHRVAIDTAGFVGTGASGQPSGIYVLAGVQSYDVGAGAGANAAPDYIDITSMIGLLGDANADDGQVGFATTPLVAATLMRTLTFPAANTGQAVWSPTSPSEGNLGGYRALASNVASKTLNNGVPMGGAEHGLVLANWSELFIGEWGAFEIIADPYSSKKSGVIELTSFQMVDVNVRHGASFVKGINAIP